MNTTKAEQSCVHHNDDDDVSLVIEYLNNVAVNAIHQGDIEFALRLLKEVVMLQSESFSATISSNQSRHQQSPLVRSLDEKICRIMQGVPPWPPRDVLIKQREAEDRLDAYLYGRGIMLTATNRPSFWKQYIKNLVREEDCASVRCSIVLYNLALAYHKSSILHHGFTNTARGMLFLKKARTFYSMSLNIVTTMVFSGLFERMYISPEEDCKILVGLSNNLGQIHVSMGNHELCRHFFYHSQFHLLQQIMTNDDDESCSLSLFSVEELTGLVFNANMLVAQGPSPASEA